MYGKHFQSMYEGSMYGAGVAVFAVWGYVIANARDASVELNPKKLADTLGGTVEEIVDAIKFLCSPDPMSRHKSNEGRRMIQQGQFQYHLPAWDDYQKIRNEDERREYNRLKQREYRSKKKLDTHSKTLAEAQAEKEYDEEQPKVAPENNGELPTDEFPV